MLKKYQIRIFIKEILKRHPRLAQFLLLGALFGCPKYTWAFVWESSVSALASLSTTAPPTNKEWSSIDQKNFKKILRILSLRVPSFREIKKGGIQWEPSLAIKMLFCENNDLLEWCFDTEVVFAGFDSNDFVLLAATNNKVERLRWAAQKKLSFDILTKDNDMLLSWVVSNCPPTDPRAEIVLKSSDIHRKNPIGYSAFDMIARDQAWSAYVSKESLSAHISPQKTNRPRQRLM